MNQAVDLSAIVSSTSPAMLSTPFDILGLHKHPSGKGLLIRVWRQGVESIEVISQPQGKCLGTMRPLQDGFFELHLSRRKNRFNYQLRITYSGSHVVEEYDPYQFGEYVLAQKDIEPLALYRHLGALPVEHRLNTKQSVNGVLFKVYAPHARAVSVVGDFNQWDGRRHPMASADDGIWRLFVPGVDDNDLYKFQIHDQSGNLLPLKTDPFARKNEQWPGLASIVQNSESFRWSDNKWLKQRESNHQKPMSIYEVHLGSWKKAEDGGFKSYRQLADELIPYVQE
ncbi:MAG: hypothetical protein MI749_18460, partial [Desulfovibrionales bacterium]|nr:hypothetical protein [Desulfovibrionales bacterium]